MMWKYYEANVTRKLPLGRQQAGQKAKPAEIAGTFDRTEIILTFNNEDRVLPLDFSEIVIFKGITPANRLGYMMNKVACRPKDVRELLLGGGIMPGTAVYDCLIRPPGFHRKPLPPPPVKPKTPEERLIELLKSRQKEKDKRRKKRRDE